MMTFPLRESSRVFGGLAASGADGLAARSPPRTPAPDSSRQQKSLGPQSRVTEGFSHPAAGAVEGILDGALSQSVEVDQVNAPPDVALDLLQRSEGDQRHRRRGECLQDV